MRGELDSFALAIRQVLLADWDPSNAARFEAASGEYDGYIEPLTEMIRSSADEEAVVDYLFDREREILCFPGLGKQRLRRVAQKLLALKSS
jgi:hypothetical protein